MNTCPNCESGRANLCIAEGSALYHPCRPCEFRRRSGVPWCWCDACSTPRVASLRRVWKDLKQATAFALYILFPHGKEDN